MLVNQLRFKVLAVFLVLALVMPMVMMPVGAAHAQEKCFYERVKYLDIEIKVIDGQPVFVYETEEGYEKIPFSMSDLGAYVDGQKVPLKTQGNSILVPTEEGPVAVPIEDFCVVMIDGQIILLAEENPKFIVKWIIRNWHTIQYWAARAAIPAYYLARIIQSRGWEIINVLKRAND